MTHLLLGNMGNCGYYISVGTCTNFNGLGKRFITYVQSTNSFIASPKTKIDMDIVITVFLQCYKNQNKFFERAYVEKDQYFYENFELYAIKNELLNIISNIVKKEYSVK